MPDLDPVEMASLAAAVEAHVALAREDPVAFNSFVLRDEHTGAPVESTPEQEHWHYLLDCYRRVVIWGHVECGKTHQLSIGRVLWELGRDPTLRVVIVSSTDDRAKAVTSTIGQYITDSAELHAVFPGLRRAVGRTWTQHVLNVVKDVVSKDPTVTSKSVHTKIQGARIDLLVLDDVIDHASTISATMRDNDKAWFSANFVGRLTDRSRVWALGNVWHSDDLLHELARNPLYVSHKTPIQHPDGASTWPARWPLERVASKRVELGPLNAARQLDCREVADAESRFKLEWINKCKARGEGKVPPYAIAGVPGGYSVFTGVDLGVRETRDSAETVLFTLIIHPDGSREVLECSAGRWPAPEIVERIYDVHNRFHGVVIVENNAAQEFILQFARKGSAVPVKPFTTTGTAQRHVEFGIESLGVEMANGKWIIPCKGGVCNPEISKWLGECVQYHVGEHPGDRLVASWFAREGFRMTQPKPMRGGRVDLMSR